MPCDHVTQPEGGAQETQVTPVCLAPASGAVGLGPTHIQVPNKVAVILLVQAEPVGQQPNDHVVLTIAMETALHTECH
ncbi:hypothetical protein GN956_G13379 [Arapaima gigas]